MCTEYCLLCKNSIISTADTMNPPSPLWNMLSQYKRGGLVLSSDILYFSGIFFITSSQDVLKRGELIWDGGNNIILPVVA